VPRSTSDKVHYYRDSSGDVYRLLVDGRAAYIDEVREAPKTKRVATAKDVQSYARAHDAMWGTDGLVVKYFPLCIKVLKRQGIADDGLLSDVGIPTIVKCLRNFDPTKGDFQAYLRQAL